MSACLAAILINGLKPIFCDINEDNFTLCVNDLKKKITNKTKAIIAVDLFGACCEYDKIFEITKKRNIKILSDSAQAIGAKYKKRYASTFTDIGGFSLNRHKHINTGEGGIIITNNKKYAYRCALLRNHGENSVSDKDPNLRKMMGYNLRLGEIEAKIGIQQLKKLKKIIIRRKQNCKKIYSGLANLDGLIIPNKNYIKQSIFYYMPFKIDNTKIANNKKYIINHLKKTGLQGLEVYYPQLNRLPFFKKKKFKHVLFQKKLTKKVFLH
jgi:perosamine synthetase